MHTTSTPSGTPCCTTPGQCAPMAAIQAMHNRYKCSMLVWAARGWNEEFCRTRGMAQALHDLIYHPDGAAFVANADASMGGYNPLGGFEAAWAALPEGFERFTFSQVQELLTATGTKWPDNEFSDRQLDAAAQLENHKVASVKTDNEHSALGAELNDGALLHVAPCVVSGIVTEGGAA